MAGKVKVLSKLDIKKLGVVQDSLEIIDWTLYDTVILAAGGTAVDKTFFQQANGQAGITKEQTNMDIPGQLPSMHRMVVQKILFEAIPTASVKGANAPDYIEDQVKATHVGVAEFSIGGRNYLECPIKNLIGGAMLGFAGVADVAYSQGRSMVDGKLDYSPVIPATYAFKVKLTYPAAPTPTLDVKLRVQFLGKFIRPRQG